MNENLKLTEDNEEFVYNICEFFSRLTVVGRNLEKTNELDGFSSTYKSITLFVKYEGREKKRISSLLKLIIKAMLFYSSSFHPFHHSGRRHRRCMNM